MSNRIVFGAMSICAGVVVCAIDCFAIEIAGLEAAEAVFYGLEYKCSLGGFFGLTGTGDLDGDGKEDLIVSAYKQDYSGVIHIYRGGRELSGPVPAGLNTADVTIYGREMSMFGIGWEIADYDGDGWDDLIAIEYPASMEIYGSLYAFRGNGNFFSKKEIRLDEADLVLQGVDANHQVSTAAALGDVNGDGRLDFLLGNGNGRKPDYTEMGSPGVLMILLGRENWPARVELTDDEIDTFIYGHGESPVVRLARTVQSGDINGDGIDDVIACAWSGGHNNAGEGYIFYGRGEWPDAIDLETASADVTLVNPVESSLLGHSLDVCDVNGDGIDDLLCSALFASTKGRNQNGMGYIVFGGEDIPSTVNLGTGPGVTVIHGRSDRYVLGYFVKGGDYDGDGIADCLFTGLPLQIPEEELKGDGGHAVILKGRPIWPGEIDLEYDLDYWYFTSGDGNRYLGTGANFIDWNGDASMDLILGDPYVSFQGNDQAGAVYLYPGPESSGVDAFHRY